MTNDTPKARRVVRDHRQQVERGRQRHAGAPDMRVDAHAEGAGHVRDLLQLGDAAAGRDIRLQDIGGPALDQLVQWIYENG